MTGDCPHAIRHHASHPAGRARSLRQTVLLAVLAFMVFTTPAGGQIPSWTKHATVSAGLTLGARIVLREPWVGGGLAIGLNVGHEIGQARARHRWTADNTRDLVGGTVTAVIAALLLDRTVGAVADARALGLTPLHPQPPVRDWYEALAQCLDRPSRFDSVHWYTSTHGWLSHDDVIVLQLDSIGSASAVTRSLLPHFLRTGDREVAAARERCPSALSSR